MEGSNGLLDEIESGIRRMKIDFDRFLIGAIPYPPDEQRVTLQRQLREARGHRLKTFADRFRLSSLEARFNTLSELYHRRVREQEMSGTAPSAQREVAIDPARGVVVGSSPDVRAVSALYRELYQSSGRTTKTDFDSFSSYLRKQVSQLRKRTGCERVRFRVAHDAKGKPTLKAKPLGAAG